MDEKTEELRDIFMDVAEEETVTDQQEESPGTLADERPVGERLREVFEAMRERYAFRSSLDDEALEAVTRGFYEDQTDEEIAADLDVDTDEVFHARLDLHLLKDSDRDTPVDFDELRRAVLDEGADVSELLADEEADPETVRDVVRAEQDMRRANYRFRDQFDDILGDGDLAEHLTRSVTDDGLEDATEGMEIDTAF